MDIITSPQDMQERAESLRRAGGRIGCVPTMGCLHAGHLSLISHLGAVTTRVMTIFVNPTQFGPTEDYTRYPQDLEQDTQLVQEHGIDILFTPTAEAMYPADAQTTISVGRLTEGLCGGFRPGHFDGVTTVVTKLITIIKPHVLALGQKDFQQAVVCRRMVRDLFLDTEIVTAPIVREPDGLALSSRNVYLSPQERHQAVGLYQSLQAGAGAIQAGERKTEAVRRSVAEALAAYPLVQPQYIFVGSPETLEESPALTGDTLLAAAALVGTTRLIDNVVVNL